MKEGKRKQGRREETYERRGIDRERRQKDRGGIEGDRRLRRREET